GCTGAATARTTGATPCLGPHKCSAAWRQRATVVAMKYGAAVIPSRSQVHFAIGVDGAGGHFIADDPRCVPVYQRPGKFDVSVADNEVDRNAENGGHPDHP